MKSQEKEVQIERHTFQDDGTFPNNATLPLVIYKAATETTDDGQVRKMLENNGWRNFWVDGVYDYHHYHSTAHEVLVVLKGSARLQFGGPTGLEVAVASGDVLIIPAGVSHKCIEAFDDFQVGGAYPEGQKYDIMKGKRNERPEADNRIRKVPPPPTDPVYGTDGPLLKYWDSGLSD